MAKFFLSLLVCVIPLLVSGFSTGAGGCDGEGSAIGSTHLAGDRGIRMSGLSEAGISVTIDGVELSPAQAIDLSVGSDLVVNIDSSSLTYLGVLVRLEAPNGVDTSTALSPSVNMQDANVCVSPITGITHENSNAKSLSTGMLRFDEAVNGVFLDVTVVFSNNAQQGSIFAYNRLEVNFVEDSTLANDTTQTPPAPSTAAPSGSSPSSFISDFDETTLNMRMNMMANRGRMMMRKGKKGMKMMGKKTKKGGKKQHNLTKDARVNRPKQHNPWHASDSSVTTRSTDRGIFRTRIGAMHTAATTKSYQMKRTGLFAVAPYRTGPFLKERENI